MYQYPSQPVWAPMPVPQGRSRVLPVLVGTGLAVALVLAIGVVVLMVRLHSATASATREPVNSATNPFLPPVGTDQVGVVPPPGSGGTFTASTPGLYGGTRDNASCDAQKMVDFLLSNRAKAAAWSAALAISPADIGSFVSSLTSVILRSDTVVINHGYVGREAKALVSVLQAGTAVLVNQYGSPVVKCYCGNPLKPYTSKTSRQSYNGPSWPGFSPGRVTMVRPEAVPIQSYTVVDVKSGQAFTRQPGPRPKDTPTSAPTGPTGPASTPAPPATSAPPQYTARDAENLLRARVQACASVQYPWAHHVQQVYRSEAHDAASWRVTITGTQADGKVNVFEWIVDPGAKTVRPVNDWAMAAGRYCPGLAR